MRKTAHSIGDPVESRVPASNEPIGFFGWMGLDPYRGHEEAEDRVGTALINEFGVFVTKAGERTQSYDLEVSGISRRNSRYDLGGIAPGLYEVKSLWRKNENCSFDRRFKVGTRGERIYGRRDTEIKCFAFSLESEINRLLDGNVSDSIRQDSPWKNTEFVEEAHAFIDQALMRRHSQGFNERLLRIARACVVVPSMTHSAHAVLSGGVTHHDIVRGFDDIQGIFVVAGHTYTLVTKAEIPRLLTFDSASSEGPKLRFLGEIPSVQRDKVIKSKLGKARKGKTKK